MDMLSFQDFEEQVPNIAVPTRERLVAAGIAILGTTRADGSARVSPIEVTFFERGLYVGCMPGSRKQLDLDRDGRCCLLTPVADKHDLAGEGKLFAVARRAEPEEARRMLEAAVAAMDHDVTVDDFGDSPVFEMRVRAASWQHVDGEAWVTRSWDVRRGERLRSRTGAVGEVVDVGDVGQSDPT